MPEYFRWPELSEYFSCIRIQSELGGIHNPCAQQPLPLHAAVGWLGSVGVVGPVVLKLCTGSDCHLKLQLTYVRRVFLPQLPNFYCSLNFKLPWTIRYIRMNLRPPQVEYLIFRGVVQRGRESRYQGEGHKSGQVLG